MGRVFNTLVQLTKVVLAPKPLPMPIAPTASAMQELLESFPTIKRQIWDSSGQVFRLVENVDVSGVVLTSQAKSQLDVYTEYRRQQAAYLESVSNSVIIKPLTLARGSPVIQTLYINNSERINWSTADFVRFVSNGFSENWVVESPLRLYTDASGKASTDAYSLPYNGSKQDCPMVTRFVQFVQCEVGEFINTKKLSETFKRALTNVMFDSITNLPTEMGANVFAQVMAAGTGDKTNILIRDVFVDVGVKITPYAAVNPAIVLGDFIIELIIIP